MTPTISLGRNYFSSSVSVLSLFQKRYSVPFMEKNDLKNCTSSIVLGYLGEVQVVRHSPGPQTSQYPGRYIRTQG